MIYLPDPKYQRSQPSPATPETLISTRLEPGVDPIIEADKRGTILLIVRLGGINLEINGGSTVVASPTVESVPVDGAPVVVPNVVVPPPATAVPVPAPGLVPAPAPGLVPAPPTTNPIPTAPVPAPVIPGPAVVPGAASAAHPGSRVHC